MTHLVSAWRSWMRASINACGGMFSEIHDAWCCKNTTENTILDLVVNTDNYPFCEMIISSLARG